jgi:hypothetical protein
MIRINELSAENFAEIDCFVVLPQQSKTFEIALDTF